MSTAETTLMFNPFDPDFRVNPYPTYTRLQQEDPVHRSPFGVWVLSRYADCNELLRDPRASSDATNSTQAQEFIAGNPQVMENLDRRPFLFMDPPDHTRLRGLVSKAFTPRVVEALRPRIQQIVDGLLDGIVAKGSLEVIGDIAYPLPVQVISEMMGVPPEDHEQFQAWSRELARSLDPNIGVSPEEMAERERAAEDFRGYFQRLIAERRGSPRDDLLSALVAAEDEGDKLTEDELLTTCILLLIAGHETTVNLIGNGMLALLRQPDTLARLRDDASIDKTAVEEFLRFDPPVQMTVRTMLDDYPVGNAVVAKGEQAIVLIGAANRDPAQFSEPERLDLVRADNRHLAFGFGAHFCLGAPLARAEGQIAIRSLITRLDDLTLDVDPPPYKENIVLRGLAELPVSFSSTR